MAGLSVIVITKNEEKNIGECLKSVRWADEIIVVDAESSDATVEKARKYTQNVFSHSWIGFGEAKNFALSKCSGEWVLWLDADERVTEKLHSELIDAIAGAGPGTAAFSMPRHANFLGSWIDHCGWYPGRVVRLFRKSAGSFSGHRSTKNLKCAGIFWISDPIFCIIRIRILNIITKNSIAIPRLHQMNCSYGVKHSDFQNLFLIRCGYS